VVIFSRDVLLKKISGRGRRHRVGGGFDSARDLWNISPRITAHRHSLEGKEKRKKKIIIQTPNKLS
jgi:hypothetical protein